jgi:hypothetical protein
MSIKIYVIFVNFVVVAIPLTFPPQLLSSSSRVTPLSVLLEEHLENLEISLVLRRQAVTVIVLVQSVSIAPRRTNTRSVLQLESSNTRIITEQLLH